MKTVGVYSLDEAALPQQALAVSGIPFEKLVRLSEVETDEVHLRVSEADFDRAADVLELLDAEINANIDLSILPACPRCGSVQIAWHQHKEEDVATELLFCSCSSNHPVAFRNPETKRGGIFAKTE